jgi:cytochrome c oxidase assembly protein subunit 15
MPTPANERDRRALALWLALCCLTLWLLVMIGGATRLTESGLSIVDWKPVSGVLPPLSAAAWQQEFARYQDSPQYQLVNQGMSLADFQRIFWFEYLHRLLARLLGALYALPLLWFALRRRIPAGFGRPLLVVLGLGAMQGYLGWYMVQSGLVDIPRVSPYRLAAHLSLALLIFGSMWWLALELLWPRQRGGRRDRWLWALLALLTVTIIYGAFVAGLRAGMYYNSFPRMGEHWIPPGMLALQPLWSNLFENPVSVQFVHRCLALLTVGSVLALAWSRRGRGSPDQRRAMQLLPVAALLQLSLGIATILLGVPVLIATLHQGGAVLVLAALLLCLQRGMPLRQSAAALKPERLAGSGLESARA